MTLSIIRGHWITEKEDCKLAKTYFGILTPQKFQLEMQLQRDHVEIVEGEEHNLDFQQYRATGIVLLLRNMQVFWTA